MESSTSSLLPSCSNCTDSYRLQILRNASWGTKLPLGENYLYRWCLSPGHQLIILLGTRDKEKRDVLVSVVCRKYILHSEISLDFKLVRVIVMVKVCLIDPSDTIDKNKTVPHYQHKYCREKLLPEFECLLTVIFMENHAK